MLRSLIFPCNSYPHGCYSSDIFTIKTRFIYFCLPNRIDKLRSA